MIHLVEALRYKQEGVIWIFRRLDPSGRTVALGSTQPMTEMSTRYVSRGMEAAGGWRRPEHRADNHTTFKF